MVKGFLILAAAFVLGFMAVAGVFAQTPSPTMDSTGVGATSNFSGQSGTTQMGEGGSAYTPSSAPSTGLGGTAH